MPRILVVDDESLIRWSLSEVLVEGGCAVTEACDGSGAVRELTGGTGFPDVVLLDFRLPDSNDLGLLATIRRLSPDSKVILMTAYGSEEVTRGALELGAYRVIPKPFEVMEMTALVREAHSAR